MLGLPHAFAECGYATGLALLVACASLAEDGRLPPVVDTRTGHTRSPLSPALLCRQEARRTPPLFLYVTWGGVAAFTLHCLALCSHALRRARGAP
eukprot:gene5139-2321_t